MTGAPRATQPARVALPLFPVSRAHLRRLTGPLGLFQHARGTTPALEHGYCTDDMARLLMVDLRQYASAPSHEILGSIESDLRFLEEAFASVTGRFRNLRAASGEWLDGAGTEDSHGRAVQALGCAVRWAPDPDHRARATALLDAALSAASAVEAARPMAYVILGCLDASASRADAGRPSRIASDLAVRLRARIEAGGPDWPWPESTLTYDNGVIPEALVRAGRLLGRDDLTTTGMGSLAWLLDAESTGGQVHPIGNRGWWPRDRDAARYDQQPIETASLLDAVAAAYETTGEPRWLDAIGRCVGWFLGANDRHEALADPADGSCRDGLGERDVNPNRGAESTLAWLASVETVRRVATEALGDSGLVDLPVA